jgi:methylenetetrahydrofolate--tRNA-(uracil-5-)-methyltransferase
MMAGTHAAREVLGLPPLTFPRESALGAVVAHLQNRHTNDFQPANVTWGAFPAHETATRKIGKKERRHAMALRALAAIERFSAETDAVPGGYLTGATGRRITNRRRA